MSGSNDADQAVLVERSTIEACGQRIVFECAKRNAGRAVRHEFDVVAAGRRYFEIQPRRALFQPRIHVWNQHERHVVEARDRELPARGGGIESFGRDDAGRFRQHARNAQRQRCRARREFQPLRRAHDDAIVEQGAQSAQRTARCGLSQAEPHAGACDTVLLEQRIEQLEQVEVDGT